MKSSGVRLTRMRSASPELLPIDVKCLRDRIMTNNKCRLKLLFASKRPPLGHWTTTATTPDEINGRGAELEQMNRKSSVLTLDEWRRGVVKDSAVFSRRETTSSQ